MTASLVFLLCSCGKWETRARVASPDSKAVASLQVKLRGATSTNAIRIAIDDAQGGLLVEPGEVVNADGPIKSKTRMRWLSPDRLRVQLREAHSYEVRSELLREPVVGANGTENAIEVEVTNRRYSEQRRKCE
jgi:hypothetical protein